MKICRLAIPLLLSFLHAGCGGGGGRYFTPSVTLNPYGISKLAFSDSQLGIQHRETIAHMSNRDKNSDERRIGWHKYYYFRNVMFQGKTYAIAIPIDRWISIVDSEDKIVARLKTPRYTRDAVAIELTHPRLEPLLAILIDQQSTSHSSTLYVLDASFAPIYKEHLLGAHWISKTGSPGGDLLLVSCEEAWRPAGKWATIGGNWQYDLFEKIRESQNQTIECTK